MGSQNGQLTFNFALSVPADKTEAVEEVTDALVEEGIQCVSIIGEVLEGEPRVRVECSG